MCTWYKIYKINKVFVKQRALSDNERVLEGIREIDVKRGKYNEKNVRIIKMLKMLYKIKLRQAKHGFIEVSVVAILFYLLIIRMKDTNCLLHI